MSMVVNDVTAALHTASQTGIKKSEESKSSITPFQKMLKREVKAVQENSAERVAQPQSEEVKSADSVAASSTKSGKVSLSEVFRRASEKYDISYDFLVAVAKAESDFNAKCVSSAGAQGIMQVMPYEQKELGIKDPYDVEQNIMGAAKLLKAHLKKFKGDYTLAAAAYNAGSGRVQKYGGVPPIKETQNYVKKIQKYMKEGVTVPNRKVTVSGTGSAKKSAAEKVTFDKGKMASEGDLEKVTVVLGTGENAVTMSYGAYLKYLEIGSTGVG